MYIHALVTIVLERAWAALKCDQLPVISTVFVVVGRFGCLGVARMIIV